MLHYKAYTQRDIAVEKYIIQLTKWNNREITNNLSSKGLKKRKTRRRQEGEHMKTGEKKRGQLVQKVIRRSDSKQKKSQVTL